MVRFTFAVIPAAIIIVVVASILSAFLSDFVAGRKP